MLNRKCGEQLTLHLRAFVRRTSYEAGHCMRQYFVLACSRCRKLEVLIPGTIVGPFSLTARHHKFTMDGRWIPFTCHFKSSRPTGTLTIEPVLLAKLPTWISLSLLKITTPTTSGSKFKAIPFILPLLNSTISPAWIFVKPLQRAIPSSQRVTSRDKLYPSLLFFSQENNLLDPIFIACGVTVAQVIRMWHVPKTASAVSFTIVFWALTIKFIFQLYESVL